MMHLIAMSPQGGDPQGGLFSTLIMFTLIIGIFYFMILRPQQRRQKERDKLLGSIKKGDRVVTVGGIHGIVAGVDEKTLLIEVADKLKLKFDRSAVSAVTREGEPETKDVKETK